MAGRSQLAVDLLAPKRERPAGAGEGELRIAQGELRAGDEVEGRGHHRSDGQGEREVDVLQIGPAAPQQAVGEPLPGGSGQPERPRRQQPRVLELTQRAAITDLDLGEEVDARRIGGVLPEGGHRGAQAAAQPVRAQRARGPADDEEDGVDRGAPEHRVGDERGEVELLRIHRQRGDPARALLDHEQLRIGCVELHLVDAGPDLGGHLAHQAGELGPAAEELLRVVEIDVRGLRKRGRCTQEPQPQHTAYGDAHVKPPGTPKVRRANRRPYGTSTP